MRNAATPARRGVLQAARAAFAAVPTKAILRFALLGAVLVAGFLLLRWPPVAEVLTRDHIMQLLDQVRDQWWAPLALIGLFIVLVTLGMPASPILIVGGAVFGTWLGTLYSVTGLLASAWTSFMLGRLLGRDLISHLAGDKLRRVERLLSRRGFWPLVAVRLLPVPFAATNYAAAFAGLPTRLFLTSSALGLLPSTLLHTFFASWIARAEEGQRAMVGSLWGGTWILVALLVALPSWLEARGRRRRYRELLARRQARVAS